MKCSKCKIEITVYDGICCCQDCKQYFCVDEGHVLENNQLVKVIKRTNYQIIYNFLCSDCEFNERNKDKAIKEHNERLAKAREESERTKMLIAQKFHSSDNLNVEYDETEKLPEIGKVDNVIDGFQGLVRPCSVYVELYGSKWPALDTKIYLTFTRYKPSDNYREEPIKTTEYYCVLCAKRYYINRLRGLEWSFLTRRRDRTFKEKFPDLDN